MLTAMRTWRHGCGPLEPWFRATPFAAAHHYRDRGLPMPRAGGVPAAAARFVATLPAPARRTLWILDLPGPLGLWVSYALRRRWGLSPALAWNGWYDPRGVLDGREEIPLLCALARRLPRPTSPARLPGAAASSSSTAGGDGRSPGGRRARRAPSTTATC